MGKGFSGLVLKAMGGSDYVLTVTSTQKITDEYVRLGFTGGGLLADHPIHPTQWVRLWIPDGDDVAQRGYTLCDPNADADTFDVEFAIHNGPAARWALAAEPGDEIAATVMGSKFEIPTVTPSEYLIFGDTASLPAINSLLDAIGGVPARVWIEWQYPSDQSLPLRATPTTDVTWVERVNDGQLLREAADQLTPAPGAFAWVACDAMTTRSVTKSLRGHGIDKASIKGRAYWK
ncbi:siderophore-interacting protein [Gordonia liuliyuniae]|uniref:Siderophore-interacting protein n=1 Tax=Gordonia liuliyuniae TaxID=2911517 RepID=A0ABS9IMY7_9ACTN|nr:siderophore-interacting protein [Gordonia liuliyuniae]MCF8586911.1 siderophore-interacting protein [Gordonia liuliyuniae]